MLRQAIERKDDVGVYFIDEGVAAVNLKEVHALREGSVKYYACALAAQKRKIPVDPDAAVFGGLGILMNLISSSGKFTTLTSQGSSTSEIRKKAGGKIAILIKISEDPSQSHVPIEALRIAAGLAASHEFDVSISTSEKSAILFNGDSSHEIRDGDMLDQYLEILSKERVPVYDSESPKHEASIIMPF